MTNKVLWSTDRWRRRRQQQQQLLLQQSIDFHFDAKNSFYEIYMYEIINRNYIQTHANALYASQMTNR